MIWNITQQYDKMNSTAGCDNGPLCKIPGCLQLKLHAYPGCRLGLIGEMGEMISSNDIEQRQNKRMENTSSVIHQGVIVHIDEKGEIAQSEVFNLSSETLTEFGQICDAVTAFVKKATPSFTVKCSIRRTQRQIVGMPPVHPIPWSPSTELINLTDITLFGPPLPPESTRAFRVGPNEANFMYPFESRSQTIGACFHMSDEQILDEIGPQARRQPERQPETKSPGD